MPIGVHPFRIASVGFALWSVAAAAGAAGTPCAAPGALTISGVSIVLATPVPSGPFRIPNSPPTAPPLTVPAMCRVVVVATPTADSHINIEVWIPESNGCATGGHQAMMEVQRFPADYHGVVAGNPAADRTNEIVAYLWAWLGTHAADGTSLVAPSKLQLLTKSAAAACDAKDGVTDGVITNVGYWIPQESDAGLGISAENTFIYMRAYPSREERDKRLTAAHDDPEFGEVVTAQERNPATKLIEKVRNIDMLPNGTYSSVTLVP